MQEIWINTKFVPGPKTYTWQDGTAETGKQFLKRNGKWGIDVVNVRNLFAIFNIHTMS